jgi:hypothetical protein
MDELERLAAEWLAASMRYWEAMQNRRPCAVVWVRDTDEHMAIFTRGEYSVELRRTIDSFGTRKQPVEFGRVPDSPEDNNAG